METFYPRTRRWTRVEYDHLIDKRIFRPDERLELLAGHLVVREPQGDPHALAIERVNEALRAAFGLAWRVRVLLPVALDDESEPEPDISVAQGPLGRNSEAKPSSSAPVTFARRTGLASLCPLTNLSDVRKFCDNLSCYFAQDSFDRRSARINPDFKATARSKNPSEDSNVPH